MSMGIACVSSLWLSMLALFVRLGNLFHVLQYIVNVIGMCNYIYV